MTISKSLSNFLNDLIIFFNFYKHHIASKTREVNRIVHFSYLETPYIHKNVKAGSQMFSEIIECK